MSSINPKQSINEWFKSRDTFQLKTAVDAKTANILRILKNAKKSERVPIDGIDKKIDVDQINETISALSLSKQIFFELTNSQIPQIFIKTYDALNFNPLNKRCWEGIAEKLSGKQLENTLLFNQVAVVVSEIETFKNTFGVMNDLRFQLDSATKIAVVAPGPMIAFPFAENTKFQKNNMTVFGMAHTKPNKEFLPMYRTAANLLVTIGVDQLQTAMRINYFTDSCVNPEDLMRANIFDIMQPRAI